MEITERKSGQVHVLGLGGRLDAYTAAEAEKKLNELTDNTRIWLVVNLDKLEYISSSGLRVLLGALKKARKQQGDIKLACVQPYVKEVFDIAGFTQLFTFFDKEEEAINSCR